MNDIRTELQNYQTWVNAVNTAWKQGWRCESGWIFISPSLSRHDLSAADFTQLDRIEREGQWITS